MKYLFFILLTLVNFGFTEVVSPTDSNLLKEIVILNEKSEFLHSKNFDFLDQQFLGQEITEELLQQLKTQATSQLQKNGDFASSIDFPEQNITKGKVFLKVNPSRVHSITIADNQWNSDAFYRKYIPLEINAPIDSNALLNQVAWFNRNPFYYSEIILTPSAQSAYIDVDFLVKDRWVLRPFAGADNTGTNVTDTTRLYAGISWGKPFGRPDLLTYQYTTAPNPHEFYAHTGSYLFFLPWKHELLLFGGFSAAHPDLGPSFTNEGISVQTSLRYNIPILPIYKASKQTFSWGIDYKNFNSNVFFIEQSPAIPVVAHQANVSQFYLAFALENRYFIKTELVFSPTRLLPNQSDLRYNLLRPHATVRYLYGKLYMTDTYGAGDKFSFTWALRAQGATGPLLPSEQFPLGGYDTVRGYLERDFLADNALCLNGEIRTQKFSFFKKDELIFLFFTDFGYGANFKSEQEILESQHLWSAGLGARYQIAPYLSLRADYGFQLHHIFNQNSLGRFHLGGSISY